MNRILKKAERVVVAVLAAWIYVRTEAGYLRQYWAVKQRLQMGADELKNQPWTQEFAEQYYAESMKGNPQYPQESFELFLEEHIKSSCRDQDRTESC